uniref:Protein kinase domain-containing protein n=1 Tax=Phasianus colchicus TaxID=9054 RepID=A0A669QN50_PHACC
MWITVSILNAFGNRSAYVSGWGSAEGCEVLGRLHCESTGWAVNWWRWAEEQLLPTTSGFRCDQPSPGLCCMLRLQPVRAAELCNSWSLPCHIPCHVPLVSFQNCLIRVTPRGREALVADFGLAREVVELPVQYAERKLSLVGSAFWMAPEMLRGEPYDRKVDVFSFGIVLCEILGRIPADPEVLPRTQDYGLDVAAFCRMVSGCPRRVLDLAACCCQVEAFKRPYFSDILDELEDVAESLEPRRDNPLSS